jgi:superfamily II DNA or RNA helicase
MTDPTTYGTLTWSNGTWELDVVPYVSMRVKRIFPRVWQAGTPTIWVKDTPEVARDLEWLLERHPLVVDDETMERLRDRAQQHRDIDRIRVEILSGGGKLDLKEPARAARSYQLQAADLCLSTGNLLLADDLGLGKTFSGLLLLRDPEALPALVVAPTHLTRQWLRELEATLPWLDGHIIKTTMTYDVAADVLITSYAKLQGWADDLAGVVRTVIFDEVHELRRPGTLKHDAARRVAGAAHWRLGMSATPVANYGDEIHTVFEVLAPDALGSRPEFLREWGGKEINGHAKLDDPKGLGSWLRDSGLLLRRTRKDVGREILEPIKVVHEVDTDSEALDAVQGDIRALAELIRSSADKTERFKAAGEIDWKLRQATGIDKAPFVAEFVRLLLESSEDPAERLVLWGWHRIVYDIWRDKLADFNPAMYTGSESPTQKEKALKAFTDGDSRVLIMSLRSGAGVDGLQHVCSLGVFGELDWSPAIHDQCIGRLARDGQEAAVAAYFLVSDQGSDPVVSEVLELKRQQSEAIRDPDQALLLQPNDAGRDRIARLVASVLDEPDTPLEL